MNYDFSDLILLVGTNPLPNYVVATHFLNQQTENIRRIWLIYSEETRTQSGTEELANNLKEVLTRTNPAFSGQFLLKSLSNVGDARRITSELSQKVISCMRKPDFTGVHLNYTGGTKAMAVHAYRMVQSNFPEESSFSYLDARDYRLKDDHLGVVTGDLRSEINIDFDSLITLHGYKRIDPSRLDNWHETPVVVKEQLLESLKQIMNRTGNTKAYIDYFCRDRNPEEPEDKLVLGLLESLKPFKKQYNTFMQGHWLEHYAETEIKRIILEHPKLKVRSNLHVESNVRLEKDGKDFELDVVVLNGYQVCGISCTAKKNENVVKQKGFEVIHRVRQIGGEEGKAVLLAGLREDSSASEREKVRRINSDLQTVSGSKQRMEVLGVSDHPQLSKILSDYIWGEEA